MALDLVYRMGRKSFTVFKFFKGYIGMCGPKGIVFEPCLSEIEYGFCIV